MDIIYFIKNIALVSVVSFGVNLNPPHAPPHREDDNVLSKTLRTCFIFYSFCIFSVGSQVRTIAWKFLWFRFAQALEVIPRVLAENSGVKPKEVISKLYAAHSEGNKNIGFDIEGESGDVKVGK
jgi:hypothetical protein